MKLLKKAAELFGVLTVIIGLIICMCEAPTLDKQLMLFGFGVMVMIIGVLTISFGSEDKAPWNA